MDNTEVNAIMIIAFTIATEELAKYQGKNPITTRTNTLHQATQTLERMTPKEIEDWLQTNYPFESIGELINENSK